MTFHLIPSVHGGVVREPSNDQYFDTSRELIESKKSTSPSMRPSGVASPNLSYSMNGLVMSQLSYFSLLQITVSKKIATTAPRPPFAY